LPEDLAKQPFLGDFYGGVKHSVRQIYVGQLGWFEGDPTFLDPLPNIEASKRYVALIGGKDKVFLIAQEATKQGDHQWSAELLTHIIRLNTKDMEARNLKAKNLREIGFTLTNNNWRNWYMTSALELEGKLDYSKAIDLQAPDLVKVFPLGAIFESLRFRVDGKRLAEDKTLLTLWITITDANLDYALTLRNGVMEFAEAKPAKADIHVNLQSGTLKQILDVSEGQAHSPAVVTTPRDKLMAAIDSQNVKMLKGDKATLAKFFSYIDKPSSEKFSITIK